MQRCLKTRKTLMDLEYQDSGQSVRQALEYSLLFQFKKLRKVKPIFHLATLLADAKRKQESGNVIG